MKITKNLFVRSLLISALSAVPLLQKAEAAIQNNSKLPNAKAGQCFARVKQAATYKTQTRQILTSPATSKRILVRGPHYRWINKKSLVRKAMNKSHRQPAQYRMTVRKTMIKPAFETWQAGHGAITRIDNMTGQIMCRVKVPAVYKNIESRTLVHPAKIIHTQIPAIYKTVKQKVLIAPSLYKTIHTPARYKTQNYRVKVRDISYIWRPILCKTNSNKTTQRLSLKKSTVKQTIKKTSRAKPTLNKKNIVEIKKIQKALKRKGFDPGEIDGQMGPSTVAAVYAFQKKRGLPIGTITDDTSRALGLIR